MPRPRRSVAVVTLDPRVMSQTQSTASPAGSRVSRDGERRHSDAGDDDGGRGADGPPGQYQGLGAQPSRPRHRRPAAAPATDRPRRSPPSTAAPAGA